MIDYTEVGEDKRREESEQADRADLEALELEKWWNNATHEEVRVLEDYFVGLGEYGERAITKDECEDMFDSWSQDLEMEEIMDILKTHKI